ncbi:MAG: TetR/AcrR family transcriptional regulator [Bdellovibrionia bacterium]
MEQQQFTSPIERDPDSQGKISSSDQGKDKVYWRILNSAILLDIRWGHLKWSITQLSQSAKVTRSLIYYYFGRSKADILLHAVKLIGMEFAGGTEKRHSYWAEGKLADSFNASRKMISQTPALIPFYDINRDRDSEIGTLIRGHEKTFKNKIRKYFPDLSTADVNSVCALFVGIVFSNQLDENGVVHATELVLRGIGQTPTGKN